MSDLLHSDSLMLFENDDPSGNEIVNVLEFYANDKLAELGVDVSDIETDRVQVDGKDEVTVYFRCGGNVYTVVVVEWDHTQGVAIPLVELRRQ